MSETLDLLSAPLITALVYGSMFVVKMLFAGKEKIIKLIPAFAIILGAVLGVVAFYVVPTEMPASNVLSAILAGGISGLAATGSHQLIKQLSNHNSKLGENIENSSSIETDVSDDNSSDDVKI